ncbi:MAG: hypothetical protein ACQSGP_20860 [Frankia sp.]
MGVETVARTVDAVNSTGVGSAGHGLADHGLVEGGITDEELTALALASDPDQPVDPAARPDPAIVDRGPLPLSYMPPAMTGGHVHGRVTTIVALVLVAAFVVITALGFCMTYGALSFA